MAEPGAAKYDVFISHASEDKDRVARPLYEALTAHGVSVWFDEAELTLGDSLRRKIDDGLARCRYGLVILSPAFLRKQWPQRELDGLCARETATGEKTILPIWHELDAATLQRYSPTLADRIAARTGEGIDTVVEKVVRAIGGLSGVPSLPADGAAGRSRRPQVTGPGEASERHSFSTGLAGPATDLPVEYVPGDAVGEARVRRSQQLATPWWFGKVMVPMVIGMALLGSVVLVRKLTTDSTQATSAPKESVDTLLQSPTQSAKAGADRVNSRAAAISADASDRPPKAPSPPSAAASAHQAAGQKDSPSVGALRDAHPKPGVAVAPVLAEEPTVSLAGFDMESATTALEAAAERAAKCAHPGGVPGAGQVDVVFSPSGRVNSVTIISGPIAGTSVADCVSNAFKRAKVEPFAGSPATVLKTFLIAPQP